jgi:hypothetical protein
MSYGFDPAFPLLARLTTGHEPLDEEEAKTAASYLGVSLPTDDLKEQIKYLNAVTLSQNAFLTKYLASDLIYRSDEYQRSMFIREIVANNRHNLHNKNTLKNNK